jgi:diguanylate cyclase (GGDEF)-like protein
MAESTRVLVVDDDPDLVRLLRYAFSKDGYQVESATDGRQGLELALTFRPQVVITDLMMPGMDGTALCRALKAHPDLRPIYVIILTAKDESDSHISNLELGADDYVVKPAALHELRARVQVGLRWVKSQTQLQRMATSDSLTGLPNRYVLDDVLAREVTRASEEGSPLSLIWLDLDHFKRINDTFGHAVGDRALQQLADIMRAQVRTTDIPARYGGEEFVIVLPAVDRPTAWGIARRLRQTIAAGLWPAVVRSMADTPMASSLEKVQELTASLGVASLDQLTEPSGEALLHAADAAVYQAKEAGRNRVRLYQSPGADDQEPERIGGDATATREVEITRLYAAIARLGPAVSFRDPGLAAQIQSVLGARAAGWVTCSADSRTPVPQAWAGVTAETAARVAHHVRWADLRGTANLMSQSLPLVSLAGLATAPGDPPLAAATAVAALDSEGQMCGGVWAAWEHSIRLTTRHKFVLGYLARVLGLELELDAVKAATTRSLAAVATTATPP